MTAPGTAQATTQSHAGPALRAPRAWALAAGYVGLYLALDWVSYIHPLASLGVTPWNPPPALSLALLLRAGLRFAPALFPAALLAEIFIHDAPTPFAVQLASALALSAGYAGAAWLLAGPLRFDPRLLRRRDLLALVAVTLAAALVVGTLYVAVHAAGELLGWSAFGEATLRFWVGDAIGVLVVAPLLLAWARAGAWRRLRRAGSRPEVWAQGATVAAVLWLVFGLEYTDEFKYFYLLFLPVIWIAMRHGLAGTALALVAIQAGLIFFTQTGSHGAVTVLELQALMLALTLTGLFLGVTVEERQSALSRLQESLRLAAAGEMAAALAHELNQPLTALASYGQAAKLLAAAGTARREELERTLDKLIAEASRAGEIVRRLRDFLRSGATQLAPVWPSRLLARTVSAFLPQAADIGVTIRNLAPANLPAVFADEQEIEIVLRNLLANALDAVAALPAGRRTVELSAAPDGEHFLRFSVRDSGAGVSADMNERLFEPFATSKAAGMGMGLVVSRTIVEAHGGALWAERAAHGAFHFTLPLLGQDHDDKQPG
ncbi:MAG: MASE1 domain-containing protein [Rhodocyclales bacterium]|nr:MASE1 domain-containing protein [Rhodocyclales bacterium]